LIPVISISNAIAAVRRPAIAFEMLKTGIKDLFAS